MPLIPLNPYLVPQGVVGVLSEMFWRVCTTDSFQYLSCTPKGEKWGGGVTLRNVWWVCATDSSKPLPCKPRGVGWGSGSILTSVWWVCAIDSKG